VCRFEQDLQEVLAVALILKQRDRKARQATRQRESKGRRRTPTCIEVIEGGGIKQGTNEGEPRPRDIFKRGTRVRWGGNRAGYPPSGAGKSSPHSIRP
ncbi:unnamed protein product, partial [Ectocarpus sp. 13 AM-2016]